MSVTGAGRSGAVPIDGSGGSTAASGGTAAAPAAAAGPRVARDVPLKALDHVIALAKGAAGRDGIVSREDAFQLVQRLEREGRGAAALAASAFLKYMDARDAAPRARLTTGDLDRARPYVEQSLLNRLDRDGDGYAPDELAKMSRTGRTLVELGRALENEAKPGRTAHHVPEKGLAHTAKLIVDAAGPDGNLSGPEQLRFLKELRDQGRGAEATACDLILRQIGSRTRPTVEGVKPGELRTAMADVRAQLSRLDLNRNGYSRDELAGASPLVRSIFEVGGLIDSGAIVAAAPQNFAVRDPRPAPPPPSPATSRVEGRVTDALNRTSALPDRATRETLLAKLKDEMRRLGGNFATAAEVDAALGSITVDDLRQETAADSPVGIGAGEVQLSVGWGLSDHRFYATLDRSTGAIRVESFN